MGYDVAKGTYHGITMNTDVDTILICYVLICLMTILLFT